MKKKIFIAGIFLSTFSVFNPVFIKSILLTSSFATLPISVPLYASDRSDFYFNRAFNKSKKGDYDGAIKDYTKVIKINPKEANAFYEPQPFPSWTLGTNTWLWNSPIPHPDDGNYYNWEEDLYQSDNTKGWVLIG